MDFQCVFIDLPCNFFGLLNDLGLTHLALIDFIDIRRRIGSKHGRVGWVEYLMMLSKGQWSEAGYVGVVLGMFDVLCHIDETKRCFGRVFHREHREFDDVLTLIILNDLSWVLNPFRFSNFTESLVEEVLDDILQC